MEKLSDEELAVRLEQVRDFIFILGAVPSRGRTGYSVRGTTHQRALDKALKDIRTEQNRRSVERAIDSMPAWIKEYVSREEV